MGEEEKKPDEVKKEKEAAADEKPKAKEEGKKEEKPDGDKDGDGEKKMNEPPPPAEEVVLRVFMHCEGCAKKVKRSLKGFDGVEDVVADCRSHKVVVKGKKAASDPLKVAARVSRKTGRKVELLSPQPPPELEKKVEEKAKAEEKKKEEPQVIEATLKVFMHCEACAQEIRKRILKMQGVQAAKPDLKASQVTVRGVFDPVKLVEYVHKRTGKHAALLRQEPTEKKPDGDEKPAADASAPAGGEDEKKADGGEAKDEKKAEAAAAATSAESKDDKKEEKKAVEEEAAAAAAAEGKAGEIMRNELHYYYPRNGFGYAYPPQIFSDENPNACFVM